MCGDAEDEEHIEDVKGMGRVCRMIRVWGYSEKHLEYGESLENDKGMGRVWITIRVWGECGE